MKLKRTSTHTSREVTSRLVLVVVLASLYTWVYYGIASASLDDLGFTLKELAVVVVLGAVAAQLCENVGPPRAALWTVFFAFVLVRAPPLSEQFVRPWSLFGWWPAQAKLVGLAFVQAWVVRSIWPVAITDAARLRNVLAGCVVLACAVAWRALKSSHGSAAALLICGIAVLSAIAIAADRRYLLAGILLCAGLLAGSALAEQNGPSNVLGFGASEGIGVDFAFTPPPGAFGIGQKLKLALFVNPSTPSPFGCRRTVEVSVFLYLQNASDVQERQMNLELRAVRFIVGVTSATKISDSKQNADGSSRVIDNQPARGGVVTEFAGTGLNISAPNGDIFSFALPLQSPRTLGSCYVTIPALSEVFPAQDIPTEYLESAGSGTAAVSAPADSTVDVTDSTPRPSASASEPGSFEWKCYDFTSGNPASTQCPAITVVAARWSSAYTQTALIIVAALIAIAAERWFRRLEGASGDRGGEHAEPKPT